MSWRTCLFILRTSISERLTYRGDFAFGTLMRFLPIVTQIFLWSAVFGVGTSAARGEIQNYSFENMVAYYLVGMLARAFSSMPGLSSGIARDIRDGSVKKFLTQPVDMLGYLFWGRVAHKLVYYFVAAIPFAFVFYLCRGYFTHTPTPAEIGTFVILLAMGFAIGFLLETLVGLIGFWFLEVGSLIFIFMMINYFLSGHMIPLDFLNNELPRPMVAVLEVMPFQYLAYVPSAVMLGKFSPNQLAAHLGIAGSWILVLWLANRAAFHYGVRRYSAYGG